MDVPSVISYVSPTSLFRAGKNAHPAFKFATAVAGLIAIVAITSRYGLSYATIVFGVVVLLVLLVLFLVFSQATVVLKAELSGPALLLVWSFMLLGIGTAFCLFTSAFFNAPLPFKDYIIREMRLGGTAEQEVTGNFEVYSHRRLLDLSQWQFVSDERITEKVSACRWSDVIKARRLRSTAKLLTLRHATSGVPTPDFESSTHVVDARETTEKPLGGPRPRLRIFDVSVDVSSEPVGEWFELKLSATYWNACNDPHQAWAGFPVVHPTTQAVFEILFPENKKPISWERREGSRDTTTSELVTDAAILIADQRQRLRWQIDSPNRNWVYKFVWQW